MPLTGGQQHRSHLCHFAVENDAPTFVTTIDSHRGSEISSLCAARLSLISNPYILRWRRWCYNDSPLALIDILSLHIREVSGEIKSCIIEEEFKKVFSFH